MKTEDHDTSSNKEHEATEAATILRNSEWTGNGSDPGQGSRDKNVLGRAGIGAAGTWAVARSIKLSWGTRRVTE